MPELRQNDNVILQNIKLSSRGVFGLTIGALGVVFGDIGTSPLYALQAAFGPSGAGLVINHANVYGVISLILWSVMIVVSMKYIGFLMRVDNKGEGGIMSLVALIKGRHAFGGSRLLLMYIGLVGVCFFFGDSAITPAISVLSAVEGLQIIDPGFHRFILPAAILLVGALFWIQKYGTAIIGRLFGPIMLLWFSAIAIGGAYQIWLHPDILQALSPVAAIGYVISSPRLAFIAMGAVVLAVTGAEALYADMGHFGKLPISRAWFMCVFPALLLCYMGQGALMLHNANANSNPFFYLFPQALQIPIVILATFATLVASQSVISGAFSLTHQAVQLNFLPRMMIKHTSARKIGQIYLPFINLLLFAIVESLIIFFASSEHLANAYGIAVSATFAITTILYIAVVKSKPNAWTKPKIMAASGFLLVDLLFVTSNTSKILSGGWLPLVIAIVVFVLMSTWAVGEKIISAERRTKEGSLETFIEKIHAMSPPLPRLPGYAIYIGHHPGLAPLALHATVDDLHELHEKVIIIAVEITSAAHIPEHQRAKYDPLTYDDDGISYVLLSYGYYDPINIPKMLGLVRNLNQDLSFDPDLASYFVSLSHIVPTRRHNLSRWRKALFCGMDRNAYSTSDYYKLPIERTIEMRSMIEL